ncbi:DNA primase [Streptococcus pneumoniae]|uniref:ArdC-like ssDNA-binding domain-containing protein n=1 Tax=Streptococcus pneumoniae TaxID=1313 RepID=UPI0005E5A8ED|nr:ArdC-like ssDNA-binding domain-containing protein [Streptococcus pneumoniae]CKH91751.1 DNA primase [Streptococcus pneumoniae]
MALTKEAAKNISIISVAEQLGIELKRTGSYSYNWVEHDSFVIDTKKNEFYWNSRTEFGDVIQLVQTIRGVSYKEAMHFLETGEFKAVDVEAQTASKEPFSYHLERYERQDFSASRRYLKAQRGLSDDTINFFISQGSIAEAIRKKGDYFEPVIVFKYKDTTGFLAGASLQGIVENREHYPERGRLKQIMRNSDGQLGFSIDIGTPKRLVFAEAPIDLMSYYELHKDRLQDVRLVAMDGVKDGIISRRFMELYAEINDKSYQINQNTGKALELAARTTNYFKDGQHQNMITLAVDNDMTGHKFITSLQEKGIPVQIEIPPILQKNQYKEDWNDFLKGGNKFPKELAHVYTVDEKSWYYQGFFEKELALAKAQELTADDVKAFVSDRQLTKEEVRQEYTRIVDQEKERKHTMSEVHEAGAEYEVEKPDNSRLAQARRKLERLKGEADEAINAAYSHQALTNGQPMNDKRGSASFMRKQEQIESQVFSKLDEIRQQEERVERLEHQQHLKEMGLNRQGSGLEMSVQNIPRIREELEKAKRGESFFTKATLKRYQEELTRLEAISEQMGKTSIQPATQALIDEGLVNQWQKQPNTYFVKGLRRVALELTEEGEFQLSSQIKYHPKTDEERLKVDELLAKQRQENVGLTPSNQEKSISPQPEPIEKNQGEAGWLEKNWDNLMFSIENKKTVVIDPTSIDEMVEKTQVKNSQNTLDNRYEKIYQYNRKDERDRDLDGDGISNSDEMLQGTDPYNGASNLNKEQEDRERRTDVEMATGAIVTDAIAAKSSEQTISQLVANKDTKALAEHLKEGMKNYLDSEQFKSFLDTMSKFHNYSLNNIHLLKMQNPNVSRVASFNKWKADFDRTVKKGSKALKIWVPYQVKTKIPVHQKELSFSPSENEMEEKEVTVTRFKLGNVFDVSQTEGKELPKAIHELTGSVKDYEDLYRAAKAVSMDNQVPISFEEIKRESTNGYYSPDENRIVISKGLKGQEQILKTIFHEMAHADLHRGSNAQYGDDQYRKQELQAESVAYVVANHFGFDTSSYSFGYLAIWAKDKNGFEDMVEQLQVVQKEAKSLIDRMDAKLELVKNKTVTKDKFADKLQQAKEKSEQLGNQKAEAVKQVEEKKSLSSPR